MKVVVGQPALGRILTWAQRMLFASAVAMLAYCGFVLMDAWSFQRGHHSQLERQLSERQQPGGGPRQVAALPVPNTSLSAAIDGLIGRIEIPRLGLSVIVVEGISRTALRRAVGHIPGTALPGQPGNVGISGHRDTFFRPLKNIQQDDIITITTLLGDYRYRVISIKVVSPLDIAVLDSTGNQILTLVTCYPFYFVGSAPDRFVVQAERIT